ncbi:MAG: beta galactosidase jelly roll domain-containing protein [Spirochaetes bacterium]|nr:beta galactosidase jelly roll domain-containing protein [Spirochaetota bacterium]
MKRASVFLSILCMFIASAALQSADSIVSNGDFENGLAGWSGAENGKLIKQDGNAWFMVTKPGGAVGQLLKLPPNVYRLKLTMRMRVSNVNVGDQGWKNARLAMDFRGPDGKMVGDWPNVINMQGTSEWTAHTRTYEVPPNAVALNIGAANFGTSGTVEFDDIRFEIAGIRPSAPEDAKAPDGAGDPWDMKKAYRETSTTAERVCINGLWGFIPVVKDPGNVPPKKGQGWGWFKVPGVWPSDRISSYSVQEIIISPWMEGRVSVNNLEQAWYRREIETPASWQGRRVALEFTMLQTHARVFIDGSDAGEIWFPGGQMDLTAFIKPGTKQSIEILVTARPLDAESTSFSAPDRVAKSKAFVQCKGITGDVFLVSETPKNAVADVHVICSTRKGTITFDTGLRNPSADAYTMRAEIRENGNMVKRFSSADLSSVAVSNGRLIATAVWKDAKIWDIDTPKNMYEAVVRVCDASGTVLAESTPVRFGFREFWVDGRDLYLNGKKIHLRALFVQNMTKNAYLASYETGMSTCRKMQEYGFNFHIFGNYDFVPGAVSYFDDFLTASDDSGVLTSFSLPHMKDFNTKLYTEEQQKRYRTLTEWLIRRVQNHPAIISYALNHNACGYFGDQNPLKIDGIYSPDTNQDPKQRRNQARMTAAIARSIDPTRMIYHHQSGNLDDMHTVNIYLNWAPRQERSEWIEHWATDGVKPLFFVEWGMPHVSSFSSFRGPEFIWRNPAFQSIWTSEFSAPFFGQPVYDMDKDKINILEDEERLWAKGEPFYWSSLIGRFGQEKYRIETPAYFLEDNWRSHRAWGISSMLPWDQECSWVRVKDTPVVTNSARYADLQKPGIVPDLIMKDGQYIYDASPDSFKATAVGEVWKRWNMPFAGFIGGGERFTDKTHLYRSGEKITKQLVILNDTRKNAVINYTWNVRSSAVSGKGSVTVAPGGSSFIAFSFPAPAKSGAYVIDAAFDFGDEKQNDQFAFTVLPAPAAATAASGIALYDPKGITAKNLTRLGIKFTSVTADASLASYRVLVIGREAYADGAAGPDLSRVKDGLSVVIFEQDLPTLMNRFGFRATEYGMRNGFIRTVAHPLMAGIAPDNLRDWRGASTLTTSFLTNLPELETSDPKWEWCGFVNKRVWRCGNNGNIASVVFEKPAVGNWLPLIDCGFDLQYSPLMEYREGKGRVIFCQLDVNGRSADDPIADTLVKNIMKYAAEAKAPAARTVYYAGGKEGAELLTSLNVSYSAYTAGQKIGGDATLIVGTGLYGDAIDVNAMLAAGANVLALGLSEGEMKALYPAVQVKTGADVSRTISDLSAPAFAGINNAELHWRTKPSYAMLADTNASSSPALKAMNQGKGTLVLCQVAPWHFDFVKKPYVKISYRRTVFLVSRLIANLGGQSLSPFIARASQPFQPAVWELPQSWIGVDDRGNTGRKQEWWKSSFADSTWQPIAVPGAFDVLRADLTNYDGYFWYRIKFTLPKGFNAKNSSLRIGMVDDESWVWLNDKFLGEITTNTNPKDYWSFKRNYTLTDGMLKTDGENVLTVLVNDIFRTGGIMDMPSITRDLWNKTYYLDRVESGDDPYRYYRW